MYRHRFDSAGGRFPGALVSLLKPAQAFVDKPSHIGDPALQNNHLANSINGPKEVNFALVEAILDPRVTFTRASTGTRVNSAGLIETVPANTARLDHDPVTLAQKGLLIEEARTNAITRSNDFTLWPRTRTTVTNSTDYPIFASGGVFLLTCDGASGFKSVARGFTSSSTTRTMSVYLRRNTNRFAQIMTTG